MNGQWQNYGKFFKLNPKASTITENGDDRYRDYT